MSVRQLVNVNIAILAVLASTLSGIGAANVAIPLCALVAAGLSLWLTDFTQRFYVGRWTVNAALALGCTAAELARHADSVTFCLSKGLAAPVGSLICGDRAFIRQARRVRKVLGGGMRQAGVLAAAGIVALTEMADRLADDHDTARRLADGLARIPGIAVDPRRVLTNIVYFDIEASDLKAADLAERLNASGVRVLPTGPRQIRAVTQYHVTAKDIESALAIIGQTMASV